MCFLPIKSTLDDGAERLPELCCLPQEYPPGPSWNWELSPQNFKFLKFLFSGHFSTWTFFWSTSLFEWRVHLPNWTAVFSEMHHPKIPRLFPANVAPPTQRIDTSENNGGTGRWDLWEYPMNGQIDKNSSKIFQKGRRWTLNKKQVFQWKFGETTIFNAYLDIFGDFQPLSYGKDLKNHPVETTIGPKQMAESGFRQNVIPRSRPQSVSQIRFPFWNHLETPGLYTR